MPINSQLGYKAESSYATQVVVDRFTEFLSENVQLQMGLTQSKGLRSGRRGPSASQRARYPMGANGPIQMEVLTKGFGFWLKPLLGAVATSTQGADDEYVHTGTVASLCGASFTLQTNRPLGACGDTDQAFTWKGCKVNTWSLSCAAPDGILTFEAEIVAAGETTATALATASYPTGAEPLSWIGGLVTVGGDDVDVKSFTISGNNQLNTDRFFIRRNSDRKEPVENDLREVTVEFTGDWDSLDQYNRFIATANADNLAAFTASMQGPTPIGGTTYPELLITCDALSIEQASTNVTGPAMLEQAVKGTAVIDTGSLIELAYTTAEATP